MTAQNQARHLMVTAEAVIQTADPDRYLARLRDHTAKIGTRSGHRPRHHSPGGTPPEIQDARWSATGGTVTMNWGRWTVQAGPGTLRLRAEAATADDLRRIEEMLTTRLENFGHREHLTITWQPSPAAG
ncbi:MAG TPA: DUF2218 domain-containing protein [Streptosporangiaceae bacterium]